MLALTVSFLLPACGDDAPSGPPSSADAFFAALRKKGLEVGDIAPVQVDTLDSAACRRASVSGIELTLCEYDDASRAKKHEAAGLALVGDTTGASLAQGKLLLVVADRQGVDKDGKRIDAITRALRGGA
jgi:hypothetical protein